MGRPPAMPLAKETASGRMPYCWKAKRVPVRPMPGLHLVHQQQPVPLLAQAGQGADEVPVHREHAALALDQLQQHGAHVLPGLGLHVGQIVGAGVAEALGQGEEVLVEHVLAGGGQGWRGVRP